MMNLAKIIEHANKTIRKPHVPKTTLAYSNIFELCSFGLPNTCISYTSSMVAQQNLVLLVALVHPQLNSLPECQLVHGLSTYACFQQWCPKLLRQLEGMVVLFELVVKDHLQFSIICTTHDIIKGKMWVNLWNVVGIQGQRGRLRDRHVDNYSLQFLLGYFIKNK